MRHSGLACEEGDHLSEARAPRVPGALGFDELGEGSEALLGTEGAYGLELRRDGVALVLLLFGAHAGVDDAGHRHQNGTSSENVLTESLHRLVSTSPE